MERLNSLSDGQLLTAALMGAGLAASSGVVYLGQALKHGMDLRADVQNLVSQVKAAAATQKQQGAAEATGKGAEVAAAAKQAGAKAAAESSLKLTPELLSAYRSAIKAITRFKNSASTPLALAGCAAGGTGCAALAMRAADAGQLTMSTGATTILPGLLLAAAVPACMTRVHVPGLAALTTHLTSGPEGITGDSLMPTILRQYRRLGLPYSVQITSVAQDVAARLQQLVAAHPDAAGAVKEVAAEAQEVQESAWTLAPGALLAGALGFGALLLLSPRAISALLDKA